MERYALLRHLQRQHRLVQRMAPARPLKAYVARHLQLVRTIGPVPDLSAPPSSRSVYGFTANPFQLADLALPSQEQPALFPVEGSRAALAEREPAREIIEYERPEPTFVMSQHTPAARFLAQARESTVAPASALDSPEEDRAVEQAQPQAFQDGEAGLPAPLPMKQETLALDASVQEMPRANRGQASQSSGTRRMRIEEQLLSAPASSPQEELLASKGRAQFEASRRATRVGTKTEAQQQAEGEAAELFMPNPQNRTPREWFDLLTRSERRQQEPETVTQTTLDPGSEQTRLKRIASSAQLAPQAGHAAQVEQPGSDTRLASNAEREAPAVRPSGVSQETAYSEHEPDSLPGRASAQRSAQPVSSARTRGARFIPAQQAKGSQNGEHMRKAVAPGGMADVEQISLSARQLLSPLVGFDPAEARIHRGPGATRFAEAQQADAVTVGDDVFLAAGHASDEPETLGLLAHELTHVARHHEPHFIPPVLNGDTSVTVAAQNVPVSGHAEAISISAASFVTVDEETLAEQVERQVLLRTSGEAVLPTGSLPGSVEHMRLPHQMRESDAQPARTHWGGLPAPWEPLPAWMDPSSAASEHDPAGFVDQTQSRQSLPVYSTSTSTSQRSTSNLPGVGGTGVSTRSMQATPEVRRAGYERSLHLPEEQVGGQETAWVPQQSEPEPDLDKLARQVYAVLKRRLDVERRRLG